MKTTHALLPPAALPPTAPNRASSSLRYAFAAIFALFALLFAATPDARADEPPPPLASRVAAGDSHSLFVTEDGKLWATGQNTSGQLGQGDTVLVRITPVQVPVDGNQKVTAVAAGESHSLFVTEDGKLWAMGSNAYGQLGNSGAGAASSLPVQVPVSGNQKVTAVAAGGNHSLFVTEDGALWAMGLNNHGQLGVGSGDTTDRSSPVPVIVPVGQKVTAVAAGAYHSLFLTDAEGRNLRGMGWSDYGQLGLAAISGTTTPTEVPVSGDKKVTAVATGAKHSLFVTKDGQLWAMGYNGSGRLGDGSTTVRTTPVPVTTGTPKVTAVAAGEAHSLFVTEDGALWATGSNGNGQFGNGTNTNSNTPVQVSVPDGQNVAAVSAGANHSLFVTEDANLYAAGYNNSGRLGVGDTTDRNVLTPPLITIVPPPPPPPIIITQPASQTVTVGDSVTFTVVATSSVPLTYQWYLGTDTLLSDNDTTSGSTSATCVFSNVTAAKAGSYAVKITDGENVVWSTAAVLTVAAATPPSITTQPVSQTVAEGSSVTFSVVATGTFPLSYQWYRDYYPIVGATSASYVFDASADDDAKPYAVKVSNTIEAVWSEAATLTVTAGPPTPTAPSITTQPLTQSATVGESVTFTVVAGGTAPLSYQWYLGSAEILGATSASYTIGAVATAHAGSYTVKVTNAVGDVTSTAAVLTVNDAPLTPTAPVITTQPLTQSATVGESVAFFVEVTGSTPINYQWYFNSAAITGATSASYAIDAVSVPDAGEYAVRVWNEVSAVWSTPATFTVNAAPTPPPVITSQPASQSATVGGSVTFSVEVTGTTPLSYQWYHGPAPIAGATSASYTLSAATADDAGDYTVSITNVDGSVTSDIATLTVTEPLLPSVPSITTQPASQSVTVGESVAFSVVATGAGTLDYQWYFNGVEISGATSASYAIGATTAAHAGSYVVEITNAIGIATSAAATLVVNTTPSTVEILTHPVSQTVTAGEGVTFSVAATSPAPLSYQWYFNGVEISGATSASYAIGATSAAHAGSYTVEITNSIETVTSAVATLAVNAAPLPPSITTQPATQSVTEGSGVAFSVVATGAAPLSYQWYFNSAAIPGATSASYVLGGATAADAGSYVVQVSNGTGIIWSDAAVLTVTEAPLTPTAPGITVQPLTQSATVGEDVVLFVVATGSGPLSYQWYFNGVEIPGATGANYALGGVTTADSGSYTVEITNAAGTVTSAAAVLTVNAAPLPPSITTQPATQTVVEGNGVAFSVVATGAAPLSYQWYLNAAAIPGATSASYVLGGATAADAGSYTVQITNSVGTVTSAAAVLTVNEAPITPTAPGIATQPLTQSATVGEDVVLFVVATGSGPLSYQWYFNSAVIPGATGASYVLGGATAADAGNYTVQITNSVGTVTSSAAVLTVNEEVTPPPSVAFEIGDPVIEEATYALPKTEAQTRLDAIRGVTVPAEEVVVGGQITYSVNATGDGLSYQWFKDDVAIPGATAASFTALNVQEEDAVYSVEVTDASGQSGKRTVPTSAFYYPVTITEEPALSTELQVGVGAVLSVKATGSDTISYQWCRYDAETGTEEAIPFATAASYTATEEGFYFVAVNNRANIQQRSIIVVVVSTAP